MWGGEWGQQENNTIFWVHKGGAKPANGRPTEQGVGCGVGKAGLSR